MDWSNRTNYDKQRYEEKRRLLLSIVGDACVLCGSKDALEFDHVNPSSKSFSIMSRWNKPIEELLPELRKCRTLCHACHSSTDTYGTRQVAHGGGVSGKRNCKCDPCRLKRNAYMRELKNKSRARKKELSLAWLCLQNRRLQVRLLPTVLFPLLVHLKDWAGSTSRGDTINKWIEVVWCMNTRTLLHLL